MSEVRESLIDADEQVEHSWSDYLSDFKEEMYPIYAKHGIEFGMAVLLWEFNAIKNDIKFIKDHIEEDYS